ncbi:MAG: hypothetical protein AB7S48_11950 [Bacteroidales bacterium]
MQKLFYSIIVILIALQTQAQTVVQSPYAAEQSHPELNIDKISFYADSTVINLTVVNKLEQGGWFCADKNIYIENPNTRQRYQLVKSVGIPNCPNTYNFKKKNELLSFSLIFPPIPLGLRTINLVENCDKACFSFRGIILDEKLNKDIGTFNQGMEFYTSNKIDDAIACFVKVVEDIPSFPTHVYGYSFYHLVVIYQNQNNNLTAKYWLDRLENSSLPDKQYFIDAIKKNKGLPK